MKRPLTILTILLLALGGAIWCLVKKQEPMSAKEDQLVVHCAASFREPMMKIAEVYEEEFGVRVNLNFGGSGALLSQVKLAGGDLFLPADESFLEPIQEEGGVLDSFEVTQLTAGIVVAKGNPKEIRVLCDLGKDGLKISLGEKSASIGRHSWLVLEERGILEEIEVNLVVTKPTVSAIVEDVAMGAVDATIAWDAVVRNFSGVEWIVVSEFSREAKQASLGILKSSENVDRARHFARYVITAGQGWEVFKAMGFIRPD